MLIRFLLGHKLKILKKIKQVRSKKEDEEEAKHPIYEQNNVLPPRVEQQAEYDTMPYEAPEVEYVTGQMNS